MTGFPIYAPHETDFSNNGLGLLLPIECSVEEEAAGKYALTLTHPITDDLRWAQIQNGCIIKANVPVRESPFYEYDGDGTAAAVREIYRVNVNTRLHLRQKPTTSAKILGKYRNGVEVIKLADAGSANGYTWFKVSIRKGGASGYMASEYLQYVSSISQTIPANQPADQRVVRLTQSREQLFRIESVEQDTQAGTVTAKASHVFYDLKGNVLNAAYEPKNVLASTVVGNISTHLSQPDHGFEFHADKLTGKVSGDYGFKNMVEILLDPDEGVATQAKAMLVRDNFDVFLLPDAVRDMGVTVRRGKNLVGVTATNDASGIVTRVIPVGRNKDGDPLYLSGTRWVDSPHIGDYPVIMAQKIDYDVSSGSDEFKTDTAARNELKRLAALEFSENGLDLPAYGMEVDFVMLQDTQEYANYAGLQAVFLYDTVTVVDEMIGVSAKVRVTGYAWDCIAEQYNRVTLGELQDLDRTVYSYNLPTAGISGSKIMPGSADGNILRNLSVQYAKISLATIEKLTADSLTAIEAHIHELVAGSVTTDQLYADLAAIAVAEITTANLQNANIDWAQIQNLTAEIARITAAEIETATITAAQIQDLNAAVASIADARIQNATITTAQIQNLDAKVAEIVFLTAGTGEFDLATIKNLLSNALILEEGLAGSMMIRNLAVTSANMLNATVDKLVVKGPDGQYYRIHIDSDGGIRTEAVTVSQGEIAAGETDDGRQIVASTANVGSLNATTVKASEAILGTIFTESLNAGKITAGDAMLASATIPLLYATALKALGNTLDISANESIELIVGEVEQAKVYDSSEPPEEAPEAGKLWLDRGVTPPVMRRWRGVDVPAGRDFETAAAGNPLTVSNRGQISEIAAQASCLAQQAGSGEPSPDNIRAISGRESVEVRACGKNLFNIGTAVSANTSGSTVEVNGDTVRVYSTTAGMYHGMKSDAISLTAGTTYTLSGTATDITSGNVRLCVRKVSGNTVLSNSTILFSETGSGSATFTPAEDVDVYVSVLVTWTTAEKGDATFENIQLEVGSAATAYESYRNMGGGEIALSAPLYGLPGAEDTVEINVDGEAQATRRTATTTLQTLYKSTMNCAAGTYAYMRNIAGAAAKQDFAALCSHFRVLPWNSTSAQRLAGTMVAGITASGAASVWMFVTQATAAEFNAWLAEQVEAGTPVTLAYERATPQAEALEAVEPIAPQAGIVSILTDADGLSATLYGSGWETVNDVDTQTQDVRSLANAALPKIDFQRVVRIDDSGLHVGDNQINSSEVLIDSESVNVVMNGRKYSRFASNYVQFGNYQLRQSADGGLVFKLKE